MEERTLGSGKTVDGHAPENRIDVEVTVDGMKHRIRKGEYIVSEFKKVVGVQASYELDEVIHGEFKPLDDNARIEIKGGEIFVSHSRTGGSS